MAVKKLRVLALMHIGLVPPADATSREENTEWKTEFDVLSTLRSIGHEVMPLGIYDDLGVIRKAIDEWQPHVAFNLLEDFDGVPVFDQNVVSYLELLRIPYTGCNPRGLMLARDKALSKKILSYHRIPVPDFVEFPRRKKFRRPTKLRFPLIVKSQVEEGSVGISQASYVETEPQLRERVELIHERTKGDAIAEEFIEGRELYATVLGFAKLEVLPLRELVFNQTEPGQPRMATYKVKWDAKYRERWDIAYQAARPLPKEVSERITHLCKRVYRVLNLSGYARIDLRLTDKDEIYVLEANPNPGIAHDEDSTLSALKAGMSYEDFIQRLLTLGLHSSGLQEE